MTKLLNQKEQHIAFTRDKAEEVVTAAKENDALIMNKISEKHNKNGQYFLVDLTYQYDTPKDAMEGKVNDVPDGQLSMTEVDSGVEYTVQGDGTVDAKTDGTDKDVPF
ncbi:MAG: hypothetical protein ABS942_10995 [Solibacillus sp.]